MCALQKCFRSSTLVSFPISNSFDFLNIDDGKRKCYHPSAHDSGEHATSQSGFFISRRLKTDNASVSPARTSVSMLAVFAHVRSGSQTIFRIRNEGSSVRYLWAPATAPSEGSSCSSLSKRVAKSMSMSSSPAPSIGPALSTSRFQLMLST